MICLQKHASVYHPVRSVFFAASVNELPIVSPWGLAIHRQASPEIREACQPHLVHCRPFHTLVSDLTLPEEVVWKRISRSRRYDIRQGQKEPLEYEINQLDPERAYEILTDFYVSRQATPPTPAYFQMLVDRCDIWSVRREGAVVYLDMVMKDFPERVRAMYGCHNVGIALSAALRCRISSALSWRQMRQYKAEGYQLFDWGGVTLDPDSPLYGITTFKRSFGGELREEWDLTIAGALIKPFWNWLQRWQRGMGWGTKTASGMP